MWNHHMKFYEAVVLCEDDESIPVVIGEEFEEAPDLLWHAGIALHERQRRQQHLISNT